MFGKFQSVTVNLDDLLRLAKAGSLTHFAQARVGERPMVYYRLSSAPLTKCCGYVLAGPEIQKQIVEISGLVQARYGTPPHDNAAA